MHSKTDMTIEEALVDAAFLVQDIQNELCHIEDASHFERPYTTAMRINTLIVKVQKYRDNYNLPTQKIIVARHLGSVIEVLTERRQHYMLEAGKRRKKIVLKEDKKPWD